MKNCRDCKHCDPHWREYSQLPICDHESAERGEGGKGIWALYATGPSGHCGKAMRKFEGNIPSAVAAWVVSANDKSDRSPGASPP